MTSHDDQGTNDPSFRVVGGATFYNRYAEKLKHKRVAALPVLRARLAQSPNDLERLRLVAIASASAGLWEDAVICARRMLTLRPDQQTAELLVDSLLWLGDRDSLDTLCADIAKNGMPILRSLAAVHLMKSGRYAEGFAIRHATRDTQHETGHPVFENPDIPWWDGAPFDGTLLVVAEQGLGDIILMSSMLADVARRVRHAVIECDGRLIPLFKRSFPAFDFVTYESQAILAAANRECRKATVPELQYLLRSDDNFRSPDAWLVPDAGKRAQFRARYHARWPGQRLVGLSWRSRRAVWGEKHKTLALDTLADMLGTPGNAFVSLQYGDIDADLGAAAAKGLQAPWVDPEVDATNDIDTLAAQIAALDLVITTSNTTAHLAGALGVPCWVLLPGKRAVIWYWGYEGERTPWYPSITLLRGDDLDALVSRRLAALPAPDSRP